MSQKISCPACGKRFAVEPELGGRVVRCTACAEQFMVPPMGGTPAAVMAARVPAGFAVPTRRVTRGRVSDEGGSGRGGYFFGVSLMVMGVLALILPFFGLQFRVIADSKVDSVGVAIGLVIAGVVVCVLAALGRWGKLIVRLVVFVPLGVLLLALAFAFVRGCSSARQFAQPMGKQASPSPARATPNRSDGGIKYPPADFSSMHATTVKSYEQMVQEYGADRVVRVIVTRPTTAPADKGFLKESFAVMRANGSKTSQEHTKENRMEFIGGPIADLEKLAREFAPKKTSVKIEEGSRTIFIEMPGE